MGWQTARELSRRHEVTVLCGDLTAGGFVRRDLDRMKAEPGGNSRLEIHYVPPDRWTALLHWVHGIPGLWFVYYAAYRRWQKLAWGVAQKLHAEKPFQVVHHLNVIGYREPGYLWKLGIPFFWGPIAGAAQIPWAFLPMMGLRQGWRWGGRNLLNALQMRWSGRCRAAARKARRIWAVSAADQDLAERRWGAAVDPMLETGTQPEEKPTSRKWNGIEPLQLIWSGAFHGGKALPILFRALAQVEQEMPDARMELTVLGGGSEAVVWKKMPGDLGLRTPVRWEGHVDREQALGFMRQAHLLVHTSLKEGTPHVVMEALAMGLPVFCHDACGMGRAVDERCGRKIPLRDVATSVREFARILAELWVQPDLLTRLSAGAVQRAQELTWENNVRRFERAYEEVVEPNVRNSG